ncbi:MAG: hypothetical protein HC817_12385 [Saprospiraceae bacterium]|nr:hypothetical protein [Saprospiraceae bacterium]
MPNEASTAATAKPKGNAKKVEGDVPNAANTAAKKGKKKGEDAADAIPSPAPPAAEKRVREKPTVAAKPKVDKPQRPAQASVNTQRQVAKEDKTIGKDDKGRTIYQGPKGGKYYINSSGNKQYLSKDN